MAEIETVDEIEEARIYEISFHIIPSLTEEDVKKEFELAKKTIEGMVDSSFIAEGQPALRTLAYSLSKTVKAVKTNYNKAYFAWIKFTARPDQISEIKKAMDEMTTIIRYLIVSTVRENTMMTKLESSSETDDEDVADDLGENQKAEAHQIPADIDKTIDELVVN